MTYIAQCPAEVSSPKASGLLTAMQLGILRRYATLSTWYQQRKLLRTLECMPQAMQKDLGWPAIDAERKLLTKR
jgi:hypothetical protein